MQWQNGGDLPRDGQVFEATEHWFKSRSDAKEFAKYEICISIGEDECVYFPATDKWLVLALDRVKDAMEMGA